MSEMKSAEYLRSLANHFAPRDWAYTRKSDIVSIRHKEDTTGRNHYTKRYGRALASIFEREGSLAKFLAPKNRSLKERIAWKLAMFRVQSRVDNNLPDGVLNRGSVITYWEEDGEYIQMVQPSVGALLADFLLAEPEHPHAIIITAELDRILQGYSDRAKAGSAREFS